VGKKTPEARFEAALRTREMVALTQQFLDGKASAVELEAWARRADRRAFSSWFANDLHTCLYNIDSVRREDLEAHLADIAIGAPPFDEEPFARIRLPLPEIARRTQRPATHFFEDGLGRFAGVRFASPATSRPFWAVISFARPGDPGILTVQFPEEQEQQIEIVQDLFDTLTIDSEEVARLSRALPLPAWRLLRRDDNANTFEVRTFTGYAKARAALAEYEAKLHKQSYWIEPVTEAG
jgi:hypothetical protein